MEIYCQYRGQKIGVSITHTERGGKCPKCKKPLVASGTKPTYDLTLLDVPEELKDQILQTEPQDTPDANSEKNLEFKRKLSPKEETAAERKFPWFVDIFLYPISKPGLTNLTIFAGVPLIIDLLLFLPTWLFFILLLLRVFVGIILFLYLNWYVAECIRDSADGWVRAPEGVGSLPDLSDMYDQTINVIGCLGVLVGPYLIYRLLAGGSDSFSFLLLGIAIILYPMGLLAVVQFDSVSGLHPRILFSSIRKTFLPYLGIILFIVILVLLERIIPWTLLTNVFSKFILKFMIVYMILVCAHLLGRLYWCHQDKLSWNLPSETGKEQAND